MSFLNLGMKGVKHFYVVPHMLQVRELSNYDLVKFSQQIACGMAYLKSKGVRPSL